ncbi:hypothetical protein [Actinomadura darangshiensis]|uniref:hypothetical protein n=1 Tax=Actinomadura darangshiensis TaxID=705336 RepID=UPI00140C46FD|nr:hypothetical protein [Actinomadura darangshiensis]
MTVNPSAPTIRTHRLRELTSITPVTWSKLERIIKNRPINWESTGDHYDQMIRTDRLTGEDRRGLSPLF